MISYLNSVQFRPTCVFQWITFVSIAEATGCLMQSYLINNDGRPREHCNHFILNAYYAQFKADCSMHRCTDAIEGALFGAETCNSSMFRLDKREHCNHFILNAYYVQIVQCTNAPMQ